jgi:hypothetical protein
MRTINEIKNSVRRGRPAVNVLRIAANVADGETVTIGNDVFELDNNSTFTAGRIQVVIAGLTPTLATPALVSAINNFSTHKLLAIQISVNEVLVVSRDDTAACGALACAETMAGANNQWANATFYPGSNPGVNVNMMQSRAANAQEVSIGTAHFWFPFTVAAVQAQVRTAAGVAKAWDGAVTISGQRVTFDNTGATDWAAGDILTVDANS